VTKPNIPRKNPNLPWISIIAVAALFAVVIFQWVSNSGLKAEIESLRSQQFARTPKVAAEPTPDGAAEAIDKDQMQRDRMELAQLREELRRFRGQPSPPSGTAQRDNSPPEPPLAPAAPPPPDEARQLALAAMHGNPGALSRLATLVAAVRTMNAEEQAAMRSSIQSAFEMLGTEAGTGNTGSLQALWQASRIAELKGYAIKGLGRAAGLGNEEALEPLLDPEKYLLLRSSATSALKPAADAGNDRAIQALAATAADPKQQGLWLMAAQGLEKAAAAGNAIAIDSLATLAAVPNEIIRTQAVLALEAAARENQTRAEEALRKLGWR
jgi:hypothetical protein